MTQLQELIEFLTTFKPIRVGELFDIAKSAIKELGDPGKDVIYINLVETNVHYKWTPEPNYFALSRPVKFMKEGDSYRPIILFDYRNVEGDYEFYSDEKELLYKGMHRVYKAVENAISATLEKHMEVKAEEQPETDDIFSWFSINPKTVSKEFIEEKDRLVKELGYEKIDIGGNRRILIIPVDRSYADVLFSMDYYDKGTDSSGDVAYSAGGFIAHFKNIHRVI